MPLLKVETSVALSKETKSSLALELSHTLARDTGKSESHVMIVIEDSACLMMASKEIPGAFVEIKGIGGLTANVNKKLSQSVCAILESQCGIAPSAVYLNFTDVKADNWGFNKSTFGES
jgi:phenylpyruvate tautomerase